MKYKTVEIWAWKLRRVEKSDTRDQRQFLWVPPMSTGCNWRTIRGGKKENKKTPIVTFWQRPRSVSSVVHHRFPVPGGRYAADWERNEPAFMAAAAE